MIERLGQGRGASWRKKSNILIKKDEKQLAFVFVGIKYFGFALSKALLKRFSLRSLGVVGSDP